MGIPTFRRSARSSKGCVYSVHIEYYTQIFGTNLSCYWNASINIAHVPQCTIHRHVMHSLSILCNTLSLEVSGTPPPPQPNKWRIKSTRMFMNIVGLYEVEPEYKLNCHSHAN